MKTKTPTTKLKVWVGNLDGSRQGLVRSKEIARKVVGSSRSDFDGYWVQQPGVDLALEPETLYTRMFTPSYGGAHILWYRGRCPLHKKTKP